MKAAVLPLLACLLGCTREQGGPLPPLPSITAADWPAYLRKQLNTLHSSAQQFPNDAGATGRLGMWLHAHDRHEPALACYQRARTLEPARFDWHYYEALALRSLSRPDEAAAALAAARRIDAAYLPARLAEAEIRIEQGRFQAAGPLLEAILREQSTYSPAWYALGRMRAAMGDEAGAADALRRAVSLFAEYGPAYYSLAQSLRRLGRRQEAAAYAALAERYRARFPDTGDTVMGAVLQLNETTGELLRQAAHWEGQGNLQQAVRLHERALTIDPKSVSVLTNLISLHGRLGEDAKAETAFRTLLQIDPAVADAHYNYGVLLSRLRRLEEARRAFQQSIRINPQHADALTSLGYLLEAGGDSTRALQHYELAIHHQPNHRLAHFHLGRSLTMSGRYAEAIGHLERTIEPEDDSTPGYLYALGIAHGRAGHRAQATPLLEKARAAAAARGQSQLIASIDKDLRLLSAGASR